MCQNPSFSKTVLITGASSGIGLAFAHEFASHGYDTMLTGTNEERLERVKNDLEAMHFVCVTTKAMDLSRERAAQRLHDWVQSQNIVVDVLVNNAGFGVFGKFSETDWSREEQLIRLQVLNTTQLTKLFLPSMVARGHGGILNVASTAAFQPGPLMSVYFACKAFMLSFTEALAEELRGSGVVATALCPGPTDTGFQKMNGNEKAKLRSWGLLSTAESVARVGYRSLIKGKTVVIPDASGFLLAQLVRLLPRNAVTRLIHKLEKLNRVEDVHGIGNQFRSSV